MSTVIRVSPRAGAKARALLMRHSPGVALPARVFIANSLGRIGNLGNSVLRRVPLGPGEPVPQTGRACSAGVGTTSSIAAPPGKTGISLSCRFAALGIRADPCPV